MDDHLQRESFGAHGRETPLETAARLRAEFGIELSKQARKPLPRPVYDELSGED
jgi:antitoxin VapB